MRLNRTAFSIRSKTKLRPLNQTETELIEEAVEIRPKFRINVEEGRRKWIKEGRRKQIEEENMSGGEQENRIGEVKQLPCVYPKITVQNAVVLGCFNSFQ